MIDEINSPAREPGLSVLYCLFLDLTIVSVSHSEDSKPEDFSSPCWELPSRHPFQVEECF